MALQGKRLIVLSLGGAEAVVLATQLEGGKGVPSLLHFIPPLALMTVLAGVSEFGPGAARAAGLLSILVFVGVFVSPQGKSIRDMLSSIATRKPPTAAQQAAASVYVKPPAGAVLS